MAIATKATKLTIKLIGSRRLTASRTFGLLLAIAIFFNGCGFHLRGSPALFGDSSDSETSVTTPIQLIYPNAEKAWANRLTVQLERARITVVGADSETTAEPVILEIIESSKNRRIASYTSRAKAAEYTLIERLTYRMTHQDGTVIVPNTTLSSDRVYQFNVNNISGKDQEERIITRELQQNIAQQLIRHIYNIAQRLVPKLQEKPQEKGEEHAAQESQQ